MLVLLSDFVIVSFTLRSVAIHSLKGKAKPIFGLFQIGSGNISLKASINNCLPRGPAYLISDFTDNEKLITFLSRNGTLISTPWIMLIMSASLNNWFCM